MTRRTWEPLVAIPHLIVVTVSCGICYRTLNEQTAVLQNATPAGGSDAATVALRKRIARSP